MLPERLMRSLPESPAPGRSSAGSAARACRGVPLTDPLTRDGRMSREGEQARSSSNPPPRAQGSLHRLAWRFCCMDSKSASPAVRRLAAARQDTPMLPAPDAEADPELAELAQRWATPALLTVIRPDS